MGRDVLRVRRPRLPLQQPPAAEAGRRRQLWPVAAADAVVHRECRHADRWLESGGKKVPRLASARRQRVDSRRRSTTSSRTSSTATWPRSARSRRRASSSAATPPIHGKAARCRSRIAFRGACSQDLTARGHRFQKIGRKGEVRYGYAVGASSSTSPRHGRGRRRAASVARSGGARRIAVTWPENLRESPLPENSMA